MCGHVFICVQSVLFLFLSFLIAIGFFIHNWNLLPESARQQSDTSRVQRSSKTTVCLNCTPHTHRVRAFNYDPGLMLNAQTLFTSNFDCS